MRQSTPRTFQPPNLIPEKLTLRRGFAWRLIEDPRLAQDPPVLARDRVAVLMRAHRGTREAIARVIMLSLFYHVIVTVEPDPKRFTNVIVRPPQLTLVASCVPPVPPPGINVEQAPTATPNSKVFAIAAT